MLPLQQQRSGCTFDPRLCRIIKSSLRMKISLAPLQLFQGLYWVHFSTIVLRKLQFQTLTYSSQETSVNYTVSVRWEGFPSFRIYKTVWASIHAMLVISTVSRTLWHSAFYSRLSKVMLHHFNMKVSFEARKKKKTQGPFLQAVSDDAFVCSKFAFCLRLWSLSRAGEHMHRSDFSWHSNSINAAKRTPDSTKCRHSRQRVIKLDSIHFRSSSHSLHVPSTLRKEEEEDDTLARDEDHPQFWVFEHVQNESSKCKKKGIHSHYKQ